ncbi:transporter substrate-binding domain-containing protein [Pseudodesulfovibrio sp. zrk46]|uniref:ATP-binding protein n=1 Tax=Pseudodesulfovibrio sp. zrk46 TaxID=2725288 RepID=UPI001448AE3C|nr:transporter substrate-binding domain-containing protein [Pseudodesulfovibrio sp. zrk46]QJB57377.1 transporter substrate-binding domain-containing protein [Pseudodesulfovibrio sp. zrk46]
MINIFTKEPKHLLITAVATILLVLTAAWYFYAPRTDLKLTSEEKAWLAQHRVIRLGATPSTRPLEYFGEKAEYMGMVADYMALLEDRLGIRFEVQESTNLKKLLKMAEDRKLDVIASFRANPADIDYMLFSRPYLEMPTVILVNKNQKEFLRLEDMSDMDLALPKSYAVIDYVRKYYPKIHIQPVYNYLAALLHVSFDEIDATIISLPQASYFIEEKGITNLRVAGHTNYKIYSRIASRSDWPILNSILQKGVDSITENEHNAIYRKWVTLDQHYISFLLHNKQFWGYLGGGILLIILFIISIIYWNRTLHRRVNERTLELRQELEARMRLLAAIEQAQDGIFILDTQGMVEYINPSFAKMTGYVLDELKGRHIEIIRSDKHSPEFFHEIWETLTRGDVWEGHTIYSRKDNTLFEVDLIVSPLHNSAGELTGYVEVARDVTERNQMEKQLRQSQKLEELGTLAGGIAHDFNNIIGAIQGYAELALPSVELESRAHVNLKNILNAASRAKEMVHQILIFSRRKEPEKRLISLPPLMREVVNFLKTSLPSTIDVRLTLGTEEASVMGDPTQIHQVITNLGTNAAYAMQDEGGTLSITLDRMTMEQDGLTVSSNLKAGTYLRLRVIDTGNGIPEDVMSRIFDPFFTTKPQGKGTGMGLSMVHGIVGSLNGEITVTSSDKGTTFTILLPEALGKPQVQTVTASKMITGQGRILLVDDEIDMVQVGEQMLNNLGYTVTGVSDSLDAVDIFRRAPQDFDLIITDQTMPHLTGDRLAKAVHVMRPDLPIILCTGFSASLKNIKKGEHGIRDILMKPFSMAELSEAVAKSLKDETDQS